MGLDINLVRYKGKDDFGRLEKLYVNHKDWNDERLVCRHYFLKDNELMDIFKEISSDYYGDFDAVSRPEGEEGFKRFQKWINKQHEWDKPYFQNIHDILKQDEQYHLEFNN